MRAPNAASATTVSGAMPLCSVLTIAGSRQLSPKK
jgi:hypothetical protein